MRVDFLVVLHRTLSGACSADSSFFRAFILVVARREEVRAVMGTLFRRAFTYGCLQMNVSLELAMAGVCRRGMHRLNTAHHCLTCGSHLVILLSAVRVNSLSPLFEAACGSTQNSAFGRAIGHSLGRAATRCSALSPDARISALCADAEHLSGRAVAWRHRPVEQNNCCR